MDDHNPFIMGNNIWIPVIPFMTHILEKGFFPCEKYGKPGKGDQLMTNHLDSPGRITVLFLNGAAERPTVADSAGHFFGSTGDGLVVLHFTTLMRV